MTERWTTWKMAAAAAAAIAALGCQHQPPKSQFPTGADAIDRMKATYACANGVQGEAKIDHFGTKGRIRGTVLLFAVNPARVRIDVLSPLNSTIYTLTSNGKVFQMLDFQEKRFLHGPATPCNLARMTQVPVPGHVLVWLLRGEAPLLKHERTGSTIKWDDGHYQVDIAGAHQARQTIHFEVYEADWDKPWSEQRLRVTHITTKQRGAIRWLADLESHELAHTLPKRIDPDGLAPPIEPSGGKCDVQVPRSIQIKVPSSGDDVIFQHKSIGFNPPIPAGAFSQEEPQGVNKQHATCQ